MSEIRPKPYTILPVVQHYVWGAKGENALIPKLLGIEPAQDKTYAELWYGAHPKSPSHIVDGSRSVSMNTWIAQDPAAILGTKIADRFDNRLPFLFKVLSASEPLSIQAHPNKTQAEQLHRNDPLHYPDDNHKPEIAIALDTLKSLCGVRCGGDMARQFELYPEIAQLIFQSDSVSFEQIAGQEKSIIQTLIRKSINGKPEISRCTQAIRERLKNSGSPYSDQENLFFEMSEIYESNDVGLIFIFLLNYFEFDASEGLFMDAGIPHAYVRGNIVECMASSDNVVRVGLTPKFKDADTLTDILVIDEVKTITYPKARPGETVYAPPVEEFRIHRYETMQDMSFMMDNRGQIEMGMLLNGSGELMYGEKNNYPIRTGQAFCIPACLSEYRLLLRGESLLFRIVIP